MYVVTIVAVQVFSFMLCSLVCFLNVLSGVSLDIENYCTIRASPACQRWCLRFLSALLSKIKGRDCGTINGHDESISIRAMMKVAREALSLVGYSLPCTISRYTSRGLTLYHQRVAVRMVIQLCRLAG